MKSETQWARSAKQPAEHLETMLSLALTNYGKQTNWFLHHRDTGIKHLGVMLAAQVSVISLALPNNTVPAWVAITTLLFLGIIGPCLARSAILSAKSSYRASIEYAVLTTKSLWALGLTGIVDVQEAGSDRNKLPAAKDKTFYIGRHIENHSSRDCTTEDIVDDLLFNRDNTFYRAKYVLIIFAVAVVALAIVGTITILSKTANPVSQ